MFPDLSGLQTAGTPNNNFFMKKFFIFFCFLFSFFSICLSQNYDVDSLLNIIILKQNIIRGNLEIPVLEKSDMLENIAKEETKMLCQNPYNYRVREDYGVNIYRGTKFPEADEVINLWIREQRHYRGNEITEQGILNFGHYTQIIWRQTTVIGCSMSQTKGGMYIIVCLYSPKGNIIGQKPH